MLNKNTYDDTEVQTNDQNIKPYNISWARYSDNSYEVSSIGDSRFSALNATFKDGTVIDGVNVGGKTIEYVYQTVIKKSSKGSAPAVNSKLYNADLNSKQEMEDFSYNKGYLPLWQEWSKQNIELIEELKEKATGKVLTDKFANTRVSQARALSDILNHLPTNKSKVQTNDENIVQQDNPNKEGDYIDVQHNGTIQEQIQTIQSNKTILSNQEILQLKPYTGSDTRPRIAVASEHTDPAFFSKRIVDLFDGKTSVVDYKGNTMTGDDFDALYIITKHDGLPMLDILNIQKPKIIHFSITTLGGSKWEPGVMKYNDLLDKIQSYIKQGLDPDMVTVRIDPIIPGVTLMSDVENVIKRSSEMGIKKIRFSVLDFYKTTAKYMQNLGFDYDKYYDPIVDVTGKQVISNGQKLYKPNARNEVLDNIANKMLQISSKYNVLLSTCAEPMVKQGITKEGCLSVQAINDMLGTHVEDKDTDNNKFRNLCSCYGGKTDILRYDSNCASSCMYCYAHHNNDKMLNYYNEDGSLKDNKFTQSEPNKKSEDVVINNIRYNREIAEQHKDWLFIFTDNTDRTSGGFNYEDGWYKDKYGQGGYGSRNNPTTAVIRGLDNAFPVSTMKWFYKNHVGATVNSSRFTDQDFEQFKKVVDDEFNDIKQAWESGKYTKIVIPGGDGFFNSRISNISEIRTPQIYQYLKQKESELMNIVQTNDKNIIEPNEELQYTTEMQNILDNASRNEQGQLLAPNGKVSNLNERQYAQVRTKSFKEWFGDWESIAEKTNYGNLIGNNSFTDLINEDGTPNWDKFDKIFDKYFNEAPDSAFSKGRYNLRNRPENHDLETNTREHIENVVQSAMKLNVSKEIRNNLIIAAMLHDIAKPFRTGDAHGLDAIKIINELFSNSKDANMIKLAVRHHMFSDSQGKFNIEEARKIIKDAYNAKVDVNQFIQLLLALNTADITRNREDNAIDSYSKKTIKETIIEEYDYKKSLLTRALNELADVSKVIDENGEPLVVYHGGAQNIDKFRNSSELERSNTGSGYYTDKKTGEKIPVDSDRTIFFSTSRGTASSYALTYAIQYFNTLYSKVNSLIGTTHEGKLQVETKYIKDVDALYDLLDKLYEFNPRYTKLKEYIQKVKSDGQTLNEKEVKSFRDMLIETRQDLQLYTSEWNLNISEWEEILNISKNILEKYNNKEGIQDLKNGQVPDYMLKQFDLYEKINEDRERFGYEKISNYDDYAIYLSNLGLSNVEMLIYDGKTLTARNDRLGLNQDITTMSEEQIKRFLDIAQQDNYTSLENYSKDESSRKLHSKSQIYSAFLNVRNPLSHDYNGTMQGQGYKQNKKQDFGYVAARQVNKAIKEGNDGVVYKNLYDPYLSDNYGVFNSEQIKTINENKSEDQEGDQIKKYCKGE